jgi:flagellar motor switch protein FliG
MRDALQKAVVFLASIPESLSAELINSLAPDAIERLADAAVQMDCVTPDDQRYIASEFVDKQLTKQRRVTSTCRDSLPLGGDPAAQRKLADLQHAPAEWLADELAHELPQTAAVVIRHLNPLQAAAVLSQMPTEMQISIIRRIASSDHTQPQVLIDILDVVSGRRRNEQLKDINHVGGLPFVAQLVNRMNRATEKALLENLAQEDRPMVDQLLRLMFVLRDRNRVCQPLSTDSVPPSNLRAA